MARSKTRYETRLHELVGAAKEKNIEVRAEKLLREVGYRARGGRCRVQGRELILLDRDASLSEQVDLLENLLADEKVDPA